MNRFNPMRGKEARIKMIRALLKDHGGRMKYTDLKKYLVDQGYYFLIEKLETMGFTVDQEGYVIVFPGGR